MTTYPEHALLRASALLDETASHLAKVQTIVSTEPVVGSLDVKQMVELQNLDLATQSVDCVSAFLQAIATQDNIALATLTPSDLAARLTGSTQTTTEPASDDDIF